MNMRGCFVIGTPRLLCCDFSSFEYCFFWNCQASSEQGILRYAMTDPICGEA